MSTIASASLKDNTEEEAEEETHDALPGFFELDSRIIWIRDRVLKFLGLQGHGRLFDKLIHANNGYFEDKLMNFLNHDLYSATNLEYNIIFFYKTYLTETVQEEIAVWEKKVENSGERKKDKRRKLRKTKSKIGRVGTSVRSRIGLSSISLASSIDSASSEQEVDDEEEECMIESMASGDVLMHFMKKDWPKHDAIDAADFTPPLGEEDKYILTKRMVDKEKRRPAVHIICGEIDGNKFDLQNVNFFYFMRTSEEPVPPFETVEECLDQMPRYIIVGSIHGRFLASLNTLLTLVFEPLVNKQFRGPNFGKRYQTEESQDTSATSDIEKASSTLAEIVESKVSSFRRPSDFRRVSLSLSRNPAGRYSRVIVEREDDIEGNVIKDLRNANDVKNAKSVSDSKISKTRSILTTLTAEHESELISKGRTVEDEIQETEIVQTKRDILNYLDKLSANVQWALQHIESDIPLTMPDVPELEDFSLSDEVLGSNKQIIDKLERTIMSWGTHIQQVLESYIDKVPGDKGPIAEYHYWHERETGLSILVEQLRAGIVQRMLEILNVVLSPIPSAFNHFKNELWKHYNESRDNTKFLCTIMRHLQSLNIPPYMIQFQQLISETDSFRQIADAIPSLVNGLKMIWILSSYYSSEEKMMSLFERISWQLSQNIRTNLAIDKLFSKPLEIVLERSKDAYEMMKNWKKAYLKTRDDIEESGKGARWEFDQKHLFQETEYIASVCKDFNTIANVIQDFYNIFGPDLKSVIYEPAQIDTIIKRVGLLLEPFQLAEFDVFSPFNKENWEATMLRFNAEVTYLENDARFFIDECFKVLINAEEALEMLFKFKCMKTRATIQEILHSKFEIVMQRFSNEIGSVENIYNRGKRNPPLLMYHSPTAGAIYWARQLFHRLKEPVLYFQNIQELKHSELKLMSFSQYVDIGKQLKSFEETKFNSWIDKAQEATTNVMKSNVLKVVQVEEYEGGVVLSFPDERKLILKNGLTVRTSKRSKVKEQMMAIPVGASQKMEPIVSKQSMDISSSVVGSKVISIKGAGQSISSQKDQRTMTSAISLQDKQIISTRKIKYIDFMQDSLLIECQLRFQVNFNWEVFEIIREAELMEQLGFNIPDVIRNVAIQKDRLRTDIEAVEKMINEYNAIINNLDKPDILLLKATLHIVEKHIQPGLKRFNWNSLSITDYVTLCEMLLKNLRSIVKQVDQLQKELDERIESEIQNYNLISLSSEIQLEPNQNLLPCKTYFMEIEARRTELICAMSKAYQSASPMLLKIESLVEGTSTGRSPTMRLLYERYEKNIYAAFITSMAKNMELLNMTLSGNDVTFQVDAILIASEVILRPSPNEIYSIILHDVQDLLERLKAFPRWMDGTCLESKPQKKDSSEDHFIISFFEDVMSTQMINDLIIAIQETAHRISVDCWKYLQRWKKYSNLWTFDKRIAGEKFSSTKPTLLQYDEKFTFYGGILEELEDMARYIDIYSVRINLEPLMRGIEQHAIEWKQVLGDFLLTNTMKDMKEFKEQIEGYRNKVELVITGLERFTLIIQAISDVKKMAIQAEVQYTSYQETFKTLLSHGIVFSETDENTAYELQTDWESLYLGALYRASTMVTTSEKFAEMIQEQMREFDEELAKFIEDFKNNGPGSVGDDLDLGIEKMITYGKLIRKYDEKRTNLANSQILFDLNPTDYSTFLKIKEDYEGMEKLYDLYKEQNNARSEWAQTLWVNLNPQQLLDGMDHFIKRFQRFPEAIKRLVVGQTLEFNMRNFKNSVPLFVELKNEAMRERHWMDLMQKTGQYFDMNPDRSLRTAIAPLVRYYSEAASIEEMCETKRTNWIGLIFHIVRSHLFIFTTLLAHLATILACHRFTIIVSLELCSLIRGLVTSIAAPAYTYP